MRLTLAFFSVAACTSPTTPPPVDDTHFVWSRSITGPSEFDEIDAVAAAPDGGAYLSGRFETFLEIQGHGPLLTSAGRADIPVVAYASDGTIRWVRHYGSSGEDNVFDATTDARGNLYLSGQFSGTVDFGGEILSSSSDDDADLMVLSLDPSGEVRWAIRAGGAGADGGNEIGIAPDGSVLLLGGSDGAFTAGPLTFEPSQARDAFVLRLDADSGTVLWGAQVAGAGEVRTKCLAIAPDGRFYAGGDQGLGVNRVVVDGISTALPAARQSDAFLLAFDADGSLAWTHSWGGAGRDLCKGVEATVDGLYVVGEIEGEVDFDATHQVDTDGPDLYAWKLDRDGATEWVNLITASDALRGAEVVAHPDGGIVFGHRIGRRTRFQSQGGDDVLVEPSGSSEAPVLVSYDEHGVLRFAIQPEAAPDANIDEMAVVGRRLYLDMPIFEGSYLVGSDSHDSGPDKDALLVSVDL